MGAKSSNDFGKIHFKCEKSSYYQGESISGVIFLEILKNFPGNEILVKFKGKERIECKFFSSFNGRKIIVSHQFSIYKFDSIFIPLGQYEFSFCINLPPNLPASFNDKIWTSSNNYIESQNSYKMKVEIKPTDESLKCFRYCKFLNILEVINLSKFQPVSANLKFDDLKDCCENREWSEIEVLLNKTTFRQNENAALTLKVNNSQCSSHITSIQVSLNRQFEYKGNKNNENYSSSRCFQLKEFQLVVPAKTFLNRQVGLAFPIQKKQSTDLTIYKPEWPSTCFGDLIKSHYYFDIRPLYAEQCCYENNRYPSPKDFPFQISIQEEEEKNKKKEEAKDELPATWNPQRIVVGTFNWNQGQMYKGKKLGEYEYPLTDITQMNQPCLPPVVNQTQMYQKLYTDGVKIISPENIENKQLTKNDDFRKNKI